MSPPNPGLLSWLDNCPAAHWLAGWGSFTVLLATCFAPLAAGPQDSPALGRRPAWQRILSANALFSLAIILVFVAFRWPLWLTGPLENPDESELITAALTLRDGGLPWKHIDCHTSGPLNAYALLLALPLGLPLDYVGARVIATLLQIGSVLAFWGAARRFIPEWAARLAVLPAINLWACRWFHDMVQYSSELPSVLLLSLAGWIGACALTTDRQRLRLWLLSLAGALLASAPILAKLQSAPLAATLGIVLLCAVWFQSHGPKHSQHARLHGAAALAAGAVVPFAALCIYLTIFGLLAQFRVFFWQSNALYAATRLYPLSDSPEAFLTILIQFRGCATTVLCTFAFGALALVPSLATRTGRLRLLSAWLLLASALVSIVGAGRYAQHYLHYLAIPLAWLAAVSLDGLQRHLRSAVPRLRHAPAVLATTFLVATAAWPAWQTDISQRPLTGYIAGWQVRQAGRIGSRLRELAAPGDKLVVWGWAPGLHVEAGLSCGVRGAQSERSINPGPLQNDYRWRYLHDLRRHRPRWFVDAVAPGQFGFQERSRFGHETWPELRELIAADYEQIADIDQVRIYRRRD